MTITTPEAIEALCDRLTAGIGGYSDVGIVATRAGLIREATATIRTLSAENARLREALEPFAKLATAIEIAAKQHATEPANIRRSASYQTHCNARTALQENK